MCRQFLKEGGGACDGNTAGAANEYVNTVMEDEAILGASRTLSEGTQPFLSSPSSPSKKNKQKTPLLEFFLSIKPQMGLMKPECPPLCVGL